MTFLVSLFSFLLLIGICVVIHEGGHYLAAVWRRVQVHEFAFGMGPKLIGKRRGETLWSWRLLPIGGFVRLEGMEDEPLPGEVPDPTRAFPIRRAWERFAIIAGGPAANILLAWFLAMLLLTAYGVTDLKSPVVGNLMEGYPAERMGAMPGDRVVSINGTAIGEWSDIRTTLQNAETDSVRIVVERNGAEVALEGAVPRDEERDARLWGVQPGRVRYPIWKAAANALGFCWDLSVLILKGLWQMLTGEIPADVAGPVGIAKMAGEQTRAGFWSFIYFLAVINLNLGLLNLMPIPALDGGRLVFLLGEMVFGRKFPERWENRIHLAGFVVLMGLILLVTWMDIAKLIG